MILRRQVHFISRWLLRHDLCTSCSIAWKSAGLREVLDETIDLHVQNTLSARWAAVETVRRSLTGLHRRENVNGVQGWWWAR